MRRSRWGSGRRGWLWLGSRTWSASDLRTRREARVSVNPRGLLRLGRDRADPLEFVPEIIKAQSRPPSPMPRVVLYALLVLFALLLVWAIFGRLDIVAVSQGKLVPQSFLKIVQPAE